MAIEKILQQVHSVSMLIAALNEDVANGNDSLSPEEEKKVQLLLDVISSHMESVEEVILSHLAPPCSDR